MLRLGQKNFIVGGGDCITGGMTRRVIELRASGVLVSPFEFFLNALPALVEVLYLILVVLEFARYPV